MAKEYKLKYTQNIDVSGTERTGTGFDQRGFSEMAQTKLIQVGSGTDQFKVDITGLFLGAEQFANAPFRVDMKGNLTATSATLTGSIIATTGAIGGWNINSTSIYTGTEDHSGYTANAGDLTIYSNGTDASIHAKNFYIDTTGAFYATGGSLDGTSTIGGRLASVLATAIDTSGHFADSAISTATSTIITPFTFGVSGALQIGTYVNGVSGDIKISPTGILGRDNAGATTFSINGTTGVAVLNGLVVGTNVGLGTAQTAGQVTTIVGNTVTTSFVNALNITANSMSVAGLTAGSITSKAITLAIAGGTGDSYIAGGKTDFTNTENGFILGLDDSDSDKAKFYIGDSIHYLNWDATNLNVLGGTITGGIIRTATSGARVLLDNTNHLQSYDANYLRVQISPSTTTFYDRNGVKTLTIWAHEVGAYGYIYTEAGKDLYLVSGSDIVLGASNFGFIYPHTYFYNDIVQTYDIYPSDAGVRYIGDSTLYYGEINYKTLVDRGCLGSFDKGVELQDGSIVSDLEALENIKEHPTKKTVYGVPMLDYSTLPKVVYKKADKRIKDDKSNVIRTEILPRDENDEPYEIYDKIIKNKETSEKIILKAQRRPAADGAETTALISIMIGAIKELDKKIKDIKN